MTTGRVDEGCQKTSRSSEDGYQVVDELALKKSQLDHYQTGGGRKMIIFRIEDEPMRLSILCGLPFIFLKAPYPFNT